MLEKDVVVPGAGNVERNIARNTMIKNLGNAYPQQKTITIPFAVRKRKDSNKKTIVEVAIQVTVLDAGKYIYYL
jgi:hypothetical protein